MEKLMEQKGVDTNPYLMIFEKAAALLVLVDEEGRVEYINKQTSNFLQKDPKDVMGKLGGVVFNCINAWRKTEVVCGSTHKCKDCSVRNSVEHTFLTGIEINKKEGSLWVYYNDTPVEMQLRISTSKIIFQNKQMVLLTIDDITELKNSLKALNELNKTNERLLSIIAHDFKNIMNSLIGFSTLLDKAIKNSSLVKITRYADIINQSVHSAFALMENILYWSTSRFKKLSKYYTNVDLSVVAGDEIRNLGFQAHYKNIHVENLIPKGFVIETDEQIVRVILRNLLNNAIKYSYENGQIQISVSKAENVCRLVVTDEGIGMNEETLNSLFTTSPLVQYGTSDENGSGLGLSICKDFVKQLGGEIWFESREKDGCEAYVELPIR